MRMLALSVALALAACGTMPMKPDPVPPVTIQRSTAVVHEPCKAKDMLGAEPDYEDADDRLKDVPFPMAMTETEWQSNWFYLTKQLTAGRKQRIKRDQEKTAVLKDC